MCAAIEDAVEEIEGVRSVKSLCTSDDAFRRIYLSRGIPIDPVIYKCQRILRVFNILTGMIRNKSKSFFNAYVAELNSIFYSLGIMATPTIKQRLAKIEVGKGDDFYQDALIALSSSAQYLSAGGSYLGTYLLQTFNIVLWGDQWRLWNLWARCDTRKLPVEALGIPVISPIAVTFWGPMASCYLRSSMSVNFSKLRYATWLVDGMTQVPEIINSTDFREGPSKSFRPFSCLSSAGNNGIFSTMRPGKISSRVNRRHEVLKWCLPDEWLEISSKTPSMENFLKHVEHLVLKLPKEMRVNDTSFFCRMSEPWISPDRKAFFSKGRGMMAAYGIASAGKLSYNEMVSLVAKREGEGVFARLLPQGPALVGFQKTLRSVLTNHMNEIDLVSRQTTIVPVRGWNLSRPNSSPCQIALTNSLFGFHNERTVSMFLEQVGERGIPWALRAGIRPSSLIDLDLVDRGTKISDAIIAAKAAMQTLVSSMRGRTKGVYPVDAPTQSRREVIYSIITKKYTETAGLDIHTVLIDDPAPRALLLTRSEDSSRVLADAIERNLNEHLAWIAARFEPDEMTDVHVNSGQVDITLANDISLDEDRNDEYHVVRIANSTPVNTAREISTWVPTNVRLRFTKKVLSNVLDAAYSGTKYISINDQFVKNLGRSGVSHRAFSEDGWNLGIPRHIITQVKEKDKIKYTHNLIVQCLPGQESGEIRFAAADTDPVWDVKWMGDLMNFVIKKRKFRVNRSYRMGRFDTVRVSYVNHLQEFETFSSSTSSFSYIKAGESVIPLVGLSNTRVLNLVDGDGLDTEEVKMAVEWADELRAVIEDKGEMAEDVVPKIIDFCGIPMDLTRLGKCFKRLSLPRALTNIRMNPSLIGASLIMMVQRVDLKYLNRWALSIRTGARCPPIDRTKEKEGKTVETAQTRYAFAYNTLDDTMRYTHWKKDVDEQLETIYEEEAWELEDKEDDSEEGAMLFESNDEIFRLLGFDWGLNVGIAPGLEDEPILSSGEESYAEEEFSLEYDMDSDEDIGGVYIPEPDIDDPEFASNVDEEAYESDSETDDRVFSGHFSYPSWRRGMFETERMYINIEKWATTECWRRFDHRYNSIYDIAFELYAVRWKRDSIEELIRLLSDIHSKMDLFKILIFSLRPRLR
jgi:hypothetical protein